MAVFKDLSIALRSSREDDDTMVISTAGEILLNPERYNPHAVISSEAEKSFQVEEWLCSKISPLRCAAVEKTMIRWSFQLQGRYLWNHERSLSFKRFFLPSYPRPVAEWP